MKVCTNYKYSGVTTSQQETDGQENIQILKANGQFSGVGLKTFGRPENLKFSWHCEKLINIQFVIS